MNWGECLIATKSDKKDDAGGPIDTQSGNYYYRQADLSLPTAGEPLQLIRSYNSQEVTASLTGGLAPGWTHHYALRLFFPAPGGPVGFGQPVGDLTIESSIRYYRPVVEAQLAGGSRIRFAQNDDGTYSTYPGAQATLTRQQVGTVVTYTLTAGNQTAYVFDSAGQLVNIRDPHGNETRLTYDENGRLIRVSDPTGLRWLDFTYDTQDRIVEVRDPIDRRVQYGYDPAGDLTLVTDTLGLTWSYAYTGSHLLHTVTNPAGELVEQTDYTSATIAGQVVWRATSQVNGAGVPLTLAYGGSGESPVGYNGQTTIVEAGHVRVDYYDVFGALTHQTDALGQTQSFAPNADFRRETHGQVTWQSMGDQR